MGVGPVPDRPGSGAGTRLPASQVAPSRARAFVRAVITERALSTSSLGRPAERLADDAALLVGELTTNALIHAGTTMDVICQVETAWDRDGELTGARIEVVDRQPSGTVPGASATRGSGRGLGLQIVGALAESWGVTYRRKEKAVWCRLRIADSDESEAPVGPLNTALYRQLEASEVAHPSAQVEYHGAAGPAAHGGTFLAEASELLSGQLDEGMVAALAGQLMVPRLADWCAVWLATEAGDMRLASVWHMDERRIAPLRRQLEPDPPPCELWTAGLAWPWPEAADGDPGGSALAFSMVSGGECRGSLVIGRAAPAEITDSAARTTEDVARRIAQALDTARRYARQTSISTALQRRQLPASLGSLPGVESAIVYEPHASGLTVGGDFYDLFPTGDGRWCFLLGDVQGKDAEAMSVTGLTRHMVRLLAREGHGVEAVLGWLNAVMAEDAAEAVSVAVEGAQPRFLSMVYGELTPDPHAGGAQCTLASAGHPLPLRMTAGGKVQSVAESQMLLGIDEDTDFTAESFLLAPGETLLCVTDGVTERRDGQRQLDDGDGLARILAGCAGMGAMAIAERVRQATHDFSPEPVEDDLAVVVLHATPPGGGRRGA
ncbi:SpoIIE family protein phosphatase [Streptomyces sp. TS71-3]|uniref:SpoIIE family protein phosphatase n=1 Tax=Streptomyces sp. TS71-3 TaxID=2733862 RepID=UPI001BB35F57|nr:SpoIIE family protein phosphatase [Streptomyces sp. TS71-3]